MGGATVEEDRVTAALADRIRTVARERRRERLLTELVCIDWELSHLDHARRAELEESLARTFGARSFSRIFRDSLFGDATGSEWSGLFDRLGL
jgi:hypothetical protein